MARPRFQDRIGVVTGAASGLGQAVAEALASEGATVVLFDRNGDGLRRTAQACPGAICIEGDVTSSADQDVLAERTAAVGPVTLLVTAAGIIGPTRPLTEMTEQEWDALFAVNVKGTWLTLRGILPLMRKTAQGAVVTIASTAGLTGSSVLPAYSASKGAVVMMSRSLAKALAPEGIRVNCVCPGSIETPMLEETFAGAGDSAARQQREAAFLAMHPMHRFGKASEVAEAVLFLLSDAASFSTGTSFPVDGGRLA